MSNHHAVFSVLACLAAACGSAPQQVVAVAPPPVLPAATPLGTVTVTEPLLQRCQERLATARKDRDILVDLGKATPVDLAAVLATYNDLSIQADNADNESSLMRAVHPDAKVRDAASECEKLVATLKTDLSLDRPLYEVFAALKVDGQPADVKRLVVKTLDDFHRAGVDKDEPTRARIKVLNDQLVEVSQAFDKSIAGDVRTVELDPAQLKGLPQDWIDAHKPCSKDDAASTDTAKKCALGKVKVSTNYPDYIPFMNYAVDDAARKQLYSVNRQRSWPENGQNLGKLLLLRHELATLLGFKDWAGYITANKMIRTEQNVDAFVERISKAANARMLRERETLIAELKKTDKSAKTLEDWQQQYVLNLVKKQKYDFDAQTLRPYLHYDKVKNGLLALTSKLFNVTYRANTTAPKWAPDVEAYDVFEPGKVNGDKQFGTIYLDMHPRDNKFKHAAQFTLQNGLLGKQLPIGVLVCNFPSPQTGNGLMEHKDVETFFHEFGHLLHHVIGGHQKWQRFSGVSTEWDFVEAPSQIFEEWSKDYEVLKQFATNDKGEVIPKALVDKLRDSDDFGKALWVRHQMFYAALSLHLHDRAPGAIDQDKTVAEMQARYSPFPFVPGTHMQASFGHLNGYSAMYYTYMWSMVIAKDMFSKFKKHGILDPATALAYRKAVLEPGGSKDAADLVADFLGRPYDFASYEDWLNQKK